MNFENISILLVGNRDLRTYLRQCLSIGDIELKPLFVARNQKDAIHICESRHIDLIIADIDLEHFDARTLFEHLVGSNDHPGTLILLLGGDRKTRADLLPFADVVLEKPFNSIRLNRTLSELVGKNI